MRKTRLIITIVLCCGMLAACSSANKQMKPEDITSVPIQDVVGADVSSVKAVAPNVGNVEDVAEPTADTSMVLSGSSANYELKVRKILAEPTYSATILVPLFPSQLKDIEQKGKTESNWQIYCSYAWLKGKETFEGEDLSPQQWILEYGKYEIQTEEAIDGYIPTRFTPPQRKNGTGWYHLRIWGQGQDSKEWLWINQSDPTCRNDEKGNPAYELWIHFPSGKSKPVPTGAPTRK